MLNEIQCWLLYGSSSSIIMDKCCLRYIIRCFDFWRKCLLRWCVLYLNCNREKMCSTHWPLGDLNAILKMYFSNLFYWLVTSDLLMIMPSDECHRTLLMMSTLVQVMAWCHQTTSHNLSQCWLSSLSPYGVTRPQWVNVELGFITLDMCISLL